MSLNVGNLDRILRFIVGLVLIVIPFATSLSLFDANLFKYGSVVVGLVLVATAAMKFCPLYRIFGIQTCPRK